MLSTAIQFSQTQLLYKKDAFGYRKFNSKLKCKLRKFFIYMVSCLFTKHLLTYCSLTIDDTEKLCQPMCRALEADYSISQSFFCASAICLFIGQNKNEKKKKKNFLKKKLPLLRASTTSNGSAKGGNRKVILECRSFFFLL